MTTKHEKKPRRRIDIAALILLLIGIGSGCVAYWLITVEGYNPLALVPAVVAACVGALNLVKIEAPRS